jgi:hypothetical protein
MIFSIVTTIIRLLVLFATVAAPAFRSTIVVLEASAATALSKKGRTEEYTVVSEVTRQESTYVYTYSYIYM